eukprot:CAMPEP_0118648248 /NCGR_PEP_ID=MMETSP0785-20121206/9053_1 /TAXON_ID=91992 /ORGANISM="Bolidomonas pacifica, Strain CCMP 1866" /LENGTH=1431 /DNA_ID=CAMNT_0006540425 /DNA_START=63 /DNA_END=4355 /DNA_ORIENTATION=+
MATPTIHLVAFIIFLCLPVLIYASTPSGLAISFSGRETPGDSGEVRTVPFLSPASSFSYTFRFKFSATSSIAHMSMGAIDFNGHLFSLETPTDIIAQLDMYSRPNFIVMKKTFKGPSLQYTDSAPKSESLNWHKVGLSYNHTTSQVIFTLDDWYDSSGTVESPLDTAGESDMFVRLGTNSASDLNFQGLMDDVCVYDRVLTADELKSSTDGCLQDSALKLELLFEEDGPYASSPSIYDSASSTLKGYATSSTADGLVLDFGKDGIVKHAPSYLSADPATSATSAIVCPSDSSTCDLTANILASCGPCTSIALNTISFGSIVVTPGSSPPSSSSYILTLTSQDPVTTAPSHKLTYTITLSDSSTLTKTLHILPNAPPVTNSVPTSEPTEHVPPGSSNIIKISHSSNYDPEFQPVTVEFRVKSGCEGLKFAQFNSTQAKILAPGDDDYYYEDDSVGDDDGATDDMAYYYYGYNLDALYTGSMDLDDNINVIDVTTSVNGGSFVTINDYYFRVIVLSTHTDDEYDPDYNCTLQYRFFDGELYSSYATKNVRLQEPPYIPKIFASSVSITEDAEMTEISLSVTSSKPPSSVVSLNLPENHLTAGTFYQHDGVTEIKRDPASATFIQYPTSATASSYWDAEGYNVDALLGKPDLYPSHGDTMGAWQPDGEVLEFSATVVLDIPVFVNALTLYQTWSERRVVKVETFDYDNPDAAPVVVFERGEIGEKSAGTSASLEDITICPTSFRSQKVKIHVRLNGFDDWFALDAVAVSGYAEGASSIITDPSSIFFRPAPNFNGNVAGSLTIIDCPFFSAKRLASESERRFDLDVVVTAVEDAPVASNIQIEVEMGAIDGTQFRLDLNNTITNVDGNLLKVSFFEDGNVLGQGDGKIEVKTEGQAATSVVQDSTTTYDLTNTVEFFFTPHMSAIGGPGVELEIMYTVTDDVTGLSDSGKVAVTIEGTTTGEEGGLKKEQVFVIALPLLGVITVVFIYLYIQHKKDVERIKHDEEEIESLKEQVKLAQAYNEKEKEMIADQIVTFRGHYQKKSGGNGLEKLLINKEEIEPEEMIGKGSFGEVFKAMYRGQVVAVKTLKEIDEANLERFRAEILLSGDLHHDHIVIMVGAVWDAELMALVMEFCEMGTSTHVLSMHGESFTWGDPLLKWCTDTAKAIHYLHNTTYYDMQSELHVNGIVHRDLKPENCLVTESFGLKVADFGEARALDEDDSYMTQVGTPMYIAPEIVMGERYDKSVDVYSFAITVLEFSLRGRRLVQGLHDAQIAEKKKANPKRMTLKSVSSARISHSMIAKGWRPHPHFLTGEMATQHFNMPKAVANLVQVCWSEDPKKRPSFEEIVQFLAVDAKEDVDDFESGGTERTSEGNGGTDSTARNGRQGRRRTSTSGTLALRLAQASKDEKAKKGTLSREQILENEVDELKEELEAI